MYMFQPFPLLSKSIQKLRTPGGRGDTHRFPHLLRLCVWNTLDSLAAAVQAKTISDMIMSMELQRPRLTPVLPQWDIGIVLEALSKPLMNLKERPLLSI